MYAYVYRGGMFGHVDTHGGRLYRKDILHVVKLYVYTCMCMCMFTHVCVRVRARLSGVSKGRMRTIFSAT